MVMATLRLSTAGRLEASSMKDLASPQQGGAQLNALGELTPCTPAPSDVGTVYKGRLPPSQFPRAIVSCCTKVGKRKKQEDRCVIVPRVFDKDDVLFLGVFDGTVGDYASEFVHHAVADAVCGSKSFKEAVGSVAPGERMGFLRPQVVYRMEAALNAGYEHTDKALLAFCAEKRIDYSACTSVTCVVAGDLLSVAHLGDSKAVLGREGAGGLIGGRYLTNDHKPDQIEERRRIERAGGSLAYLHGGKPFIRGGDFTERQARGERPMQLNYSRAFGGKDLKCYGLSADPDIIQIQLTKADKLLVIASDGLWDVATADDAARMAWDAYSAGRDPSLELTDWALAQHDARGSIDNVTVIVAVFTHPPPVLAPVVNGALSTGPSSSAAASLSASHSSNSLSRQQPAQPGSGGNTPGAK